MWAEQSSPSDESCARRIGLLPQKEAIDGSLWVGLISNKWLSLRYPEALNSSGLAALIHFSTSARRLVASLNISSASLSDTAPATS